LVEEENLKGTFIPSVVFSITAGRLFSAPLAQRNKLVESVFALCMVTFKPYCSLNYKCTVSRVIANTADTT